MSLGPITSEQIARLRGDLRIGLPILLHGSGQTALILAAETLRAKRFDALRDLDPDALLAITNRRAETLRARAYDGDLARIRLPRDADAAWVQSVADPSLDLIAPMKGPCQSEREGPADLHRAALALCKQAHLLPAALVAFPKPDQLASLDPNLSCFDVGEDTAAFGDPSPLSRVASARVPLAVSEAGRLHVFRPEDGGDEHYAVEIGRPDRSEPVLSRLHSACFTGDLLGSLKCDCGPQLRAALAQIGSEGHGVLLYLNQEGRGIGLANKMRAYALQDQGFDTVEANHRLGFEDDERDFNIGAEILRKLGFSAVRLMTNNPGKIAMMEQAGLRVAEHVPLRVGRNAHNTDYLDTKAAKSGHML